MAAGFVTFLAVMPAIPELITEKQFMAKNQIFEFDAHQAAMEPSSTKQTNTVLEKQKKKSSSSSTPDSHYTIKDSAPQLSPSKDAGGSNAGSGKRHRGKAQLDCEELDEAEVEQEKEPLDWAACRPSGNGMVAAPMRDMDAKPEPEPEAWVVVEGH